MIFTFSDNDVDFICWGVRVSRISISSPEIATFFITLLKIKAILDNGKKAMPSHADQGYILEASCAVTLGCGREPCEASKGSWSDRGSSKPWQKSRYA